MPEKIVSTTLDACWKAIKVWPDTKGAFGHKFESDEDIRQFEKTGISVAHIGDKAAGIITNQPFNVVPMKTQSLEWPIAFKVEIWKRGDQYRATMDLLVDIIRAFFKAVEGTGPTVLEQASCGPPRQIISFEVSIVDIPQGENANSTLQVCYGSVVVVFQGTFHL